MGYSRLFGSQFPEQAIEPGSHKDIDDAVAELINQYNICIQANDLKWAAEIYEENKDILEPYIINAAYINRLEEEIYNAGIYATTNGGGASGTIISETEPDIEQTEGDYWLSDY